MYKGKHADPAKPPCCSPNLHHVLCETPLGYVVVVGFATQGALGGCTASRPWASEYNAFGVNPLAILVATDW